MSITFPTGSAGGAEMCASVTVNSDHMVETEEYFIVMLALETSGTSLSLGRNTSVITLIDSDGIVFYTNVSFPLLFPCIAAMFAVPTMATVAESDTTLTMCVTMTTTPPIATIANPVVVSLSIVDGTGEKDYDDCLTCIHSKTFATFLQQTSVETLPHSFNP